MIHLFDSTGGASQRRFGPGTPAGGPPPGALGLGRVGLGRAGFDPRLIDAQLAADVAAAQRGNRAELHSAKLFGRAANRGAVPLHVIGEGGSVQLGGKRFEGNRLALEWDPAAGVLLDRAGTPIMLGLTPGDVHDPTELATYLAGYSNEDFQHEKACQVIPSDHDEDKYRTFNSSLAFRPVVVKTDDDATPAELKAPSSLTNYKVVIRRIAAFIPDPTQKQVTNPGYDLRFVHMERCKRAINMDLELDVLGASGLLTTSGNWNSNNRVTLGANYAWGDTAGNAANAGALSDPIADLQARVVASAQRITSWFMNQRVALCFLAHPKVRDYYRMHFGDNAITNTMASISDADAGVVEFKMPLLGTFKVCCARVESNTAGTTTDYIMPDVVIAVTQPPGIPTNGDRIATAYNFRRKGLAGVGFYTREVRFDARGAGGTLIIVEEASIPTMTSGICGGYIGAVLQ